MKWIVCYVERAVPEWLALFASLPTTRCTSDWVVLEDGELFSGVDRLTISSLPLQITLESYVEHRGLAVRIQAIIARAKLVGVSEIVVLSSPEQYVEKPVWTGRQSDLSFAFCDWRTPMVRLRLKNLTTYPDERLSGPLTILDWYLRSNAGTIYGMPDQKHFRSQLPTRLTLYFWIRNAFWLESRYSLSIAIRFGLITRIISTIFQFSQPFELRALITSAIQDGIRLSSSPPKHHD